MHLELHLHMFDQSSVKMVSGVVKLVVLRVTLVSHLIFDDHRFCLVSNFGTSICRHTIIFSTS